MFWISKPVFFSEHRHLHTVVYKSVFRCSEFWNESLVEVTMEDSASFQIPSWGMKFGESPLLWQHSLLLAGCGTFSAEIGHRFKQFSVCTILVSACTVFSFKESKNQTKAKKRTVPLTKRNRLKTLVCDLAKLTWSEKEGCPGSWTGHTNIYTAYIIAFPQKVTWMFLRVI